VTSYNLDPVWYADSVAMDHITGDLDKMTMKENYGAQDQVHAANDTSMMIKRIGHFTVSTPYWHILLKNVLHVPRATRNLASVHQLTSNNDIFLELHPRWLYCHTCTIGCMHLI
jgi:hypothetical protein